MATICVYFFFINMMKWLDWIYEPVTFWGSSLVCLGFTQVLILSTIWATRWRQNAVLCSNARWDEALKVLQHVTNTALRTIVDKHDVFFFQVGNMKKETSAVWYKDGHEIKSDQNLGFTEGVLKLEIAQVGIFENTFFKWNICHISTIS